jgi:hypothetical protein
LHRQETILFYHLYKRDFKTILRANIVTYNNVKDGYYNRNSTTHLILSKDFDAVFNDINKSNLTNEEKEYLYLYCQHLANRYIRPFKRDSFLIKQEPINDACEAFINKYPTSTFLPRIDKNIYSKNHYNNTGTGVNVHYGRSYHTGKINQFTKPTDTYLFGLGLELSGQKHILFIDGSLNLMQLKQDIKIDSLIIPKKFELRNTIFSINYGKSYQLNKGVILTPFAGYEARTFFPFIADSVIALPFDKERMNLRYLNLGLNSRFKIFENVTSRDAINRQPATAVFLALNHNCAIPLLNKTIYQPVTQAIKISLIFKNLAVVNKPLADALKN